MASERIDYLELQKQLLRGVRGGHSQRKLAGKLAVNDYVVFNWETGKRRLHWSSFVDLCTASGVDLSRAVRSTFHYTGDVQKTSRFLHFLVAHATPVQISKTCQVSASTVYRWLSGKSEPELVDMLRIFHAGPPLLLRFCAYLVDPAALPVLKNQYTLMQQYAIYEAKKPWASAILLALALAHPPRSRREVLERTAMAAGVSREELKVCIKELADLMIIDKKSLKPSTFVLGDYAPPRSLSLEHRLGVTRYWFGRAPTIPDLGSREKLLGGRELTYMAHHIYGSSFETQRRIKVMSIRFVRSVMQLVAEPQDIETVSALLFSTFSVGVHPHANSID